MSAPVASKPSIKEQLSNVGKRLKESLSKKEESPEDRAARLSKLRSEKESLKEEVDVLSLKKRKTEIQQKIQKAKMGRMEAATKASGGIFGGGGQVGGSDMAAGLNMEAWNGMFQTGGGSQQKLKKGMTTFNHQDTNAFAMSMGNWDGNILHSGGSNTKKKKGDGWDGNIMHMP